MLKKLSVFFVSALLCVSTIPATKVNAKVDVEPENVVNLQSDVVDSYMTINGETVYVNDELTTNEIKAQIKASLKETLSEEQLENLIIEEEVSNSNISLRSLNQDPVGSQRKTVYLGAAGGQSGPVIFPSGGTINWQDGGASISCSFSINGGLYSVGVSVGYITSGVTGYSVWVNPGVRYLLGVKKDVTATRWHVYGYDPSTMTTWVDTYVTTVATNSTSFYNAA
jgi:hypothetical protein